MKSFREYITLNEAEFDGFIEELNKIENIKEKKKFAMTHLRQYRSEHTSTEYNMYTFKLVKKYPHLKELIFQEKDKIFRSEYPKGTKAFFHEYNLKPSYEEKKKYAINYFRRLYETDKEKHQILIDNIKGKIDESIFKEIKNYIFLVKENTGGVEYIKERIKLMKSDDEKINYIVDFIKKKKKQISKEAFSFYIINIKREAVNNKIFYKALEILDIKPDLKSQENVNEIFYNETYKKLSSTKDRQKALIDFLKKRKKESSMLYSNSIVFFRKKIDKRTLEKVMNEIVKKTTETERGQKVIKTKVFFYENKNLSDDEFIKKAIENYRNLSTKEKETFFNNLQKSNKKHLSEILKKEIYKTSMILKRANKSEGLIAKGNTKKIQDSEITRGGIKRTNLLELQNAVLNGTSEEQLKAFENMISSGDFLKDDVSYERKKLTNKDIRIEAKDKLGILKDLELVGDKIKIKTKDKEGNVVLKDFISRNVHNIPYSIFFIKPDLKLHKIKDEEILTKYNSAVEVLKRNKDKLDSQLDAKIKEQIKQGLGGARKRLFIAITDIRTTNRFYIWIKMEKKINDLKFYLDNSPKSQSSYHVYVDINNIKPEDFWISQPRQLEEQLLSFLKELQG